VRLVDVLFRGKIGYGSCDLKDAAVAARRHAEAIDHHLQQLLPLPIQLTEAFQVPRLHLAVGVQSVGGKALALDLARCFDPLTDGGGGFRRSRRGEVLVGDAGGFDVQVDAIQQRAGEAAAVALGHQRGAGTGMLRVA